MRFIVVTALRQFAVRRKVQPYVMQYKNTLLFCDITKDSQSWPQTCVGFTQRRVDLVSGYWLVGYMIRQDMAETI